MHICFVILSIYPNTNIRICVENMKAAVLKKVGPTLRTALFSKLGPGARISSHRGWADLANHVLRCHLGLVVPPGEVH